MPNLYNATANSAPGTDVAAAVPAPGAAAVEEGGGGGGVSVVYHVLPERSRARDGGGEPSIYKAERHLNHCAKIEPAQDLQDQRTQRTQRTQVGLEADGFRLNPKVGRYFQRYEVASGRYVPLGYLARRYPGTM